jgi:PAS domain S-box-containing protein
MIAMLSGSEHVFEFANPAYLDLIGRPNVIGQRVRDALPELEQQGTVALLDKVYTTGEPFVGRQMPFAFQRQPGTPSETRYIDFVYQPVMDDQGRVTGIFAQGFDVTEQVQSQIALRDSEAHLTALFAQAAAGLAECDLSGHFLRVNERYCEIVGRSREELLAGLRMQDITHPDDLPGNVRAFQQVSRTGGSFEVEKRYLHPDGRIVWVRNAVTPVYDEAGHPRTMVAVSLDLTRRRKAEAALRESEERHRVLFEQAAVGVAHTDLGGRWLMINQRLCEILGYTKDELIGRTFQTITHPDDLKDDLPLVRALDAGEIPSFRREKRYICKDGSVVWVETTVSLVHDQSGAPSYRVAVIQDIQERKKAEEASRTSESRLRLALDAGRMAVWESDTRTNSVTTSPELNRLLGFAEDATPTIEEIRSRYAPGAQDRLRAAASAALSRGEHHAEEELEVIWPDGSHHWLMLRADLEVTPGPDGAVHIRATGVAFDITERKLWEERQRLLINELNHRVKNTLATVQSVAVQSFRELGARSSPNFMAFQDRLFALARAHDILTRENWEGAELREVIGEVTEPYCRQSSGRCEIDGPRLRLTPSMALALAMAVHELGTNAAKYGALSIPTGHVSITWAVTPGEPRHLTMCWQEHGGPLVVPPTRKGFGTRLIERSLAQELSGEVNIAYEPTGVVCMIKAPLNEQTREEAGQAALKPASA